MEAAAQINSEMSMVARQAMSISEQFEAAQATRPFTEKFEAFAAPRSSRSPNFCLALAVTDDRRRDAVSWLAGEAAADLVANLSTQPDRIILELSETAAVSVTIDMTPPRLFDSVEQCLEEMNGHGGCRQLRVVLPLVPGRLEGSIQLVCLPALVERPGLTGSVIAECCLLVAVSGDTPWNIDECEGLTELSAGIGAALPARMGSAASFALPHCPIRLPLEMPAKGQADLPNCLLKEAPVRDGLISCRESRRLKLLVEALNGQYERELRQSNALKVKEERTARGLEDAGRSRDYRSEIDRIRTSFADDLRRALDQVSEANRNATLPQGAVTLAMNKAVEAVAATDIEFEEGPTSLILRLYPQTLDILSKSCGDMLREQLRSDLNTLRGRLKEIETELSRMLMQFSGVPITLNLTQPEEGELWRKMMEMISLEIRYRGEMPKRSFFNRISEGRRPVFVLLMAGSMVGGAFGFNMRARPFMLMFLVIFVIGFIYTFFSWRKEDHARIEKELERVRETLITELKRLITEVQREKLSRIQAYFEDVRRDVERRIDTYLREVQKTDTDRANDDRRESRARQRTIDQRQRELSGQSGALTRLLQSCSDIERKCIQAARQTAQAAAAS